LAFHLGRSDPFRITATPPLNQPLLLDSSSCQDRLCVREWTSASSAISEKGTNLRRNVSGSFLPWTASQRRVSNFGKPDEAGKRPKVPLVRESAHALTSHEGQGIPAVGGILKTHPQSSIARNAALS